MRIKKKLKRSIKMFRSKIGSKKKISNYIKNLDDSEKLKVIMGGHWSCASGWLSLNEAEQDITQPLIFDDNSVDVIFTEHVIEHISFLETIGFMGEAKRVLKPGGVLRIVCPMFEKMLTDDFSSENGQKYINNFLVPRLFSKEDKKLKELNLAGIAASPKLFLFNSVFVNHGHRFIWSGELMNKVLTSLQFRDVKIRNVGDGVEQDYCIERRKRGIYLGYDWEEDRSDGVIYDPESLVVEAIK